MTAGEIFHATAYLTCYYGYLSACSIAFVDVAVPSPDDLPKFSELNWGNNIIIK